MKKMIVGRLVIIVFVCAVFMLLKPPCLFRQFLGFACPGCGMTRAAYALLRLDFRAAFAYNPLIYLLPVVVWAIVTEGRMAKSRCVNRAILIGLLVVSILIYILLLTKGGYDNVL